MKSLYPAFAMILLASCIKKDYYQPEDDEILSHAAYSVGTVISYRGGFGGVSPKVYYSFSVNGVAYTRNYGTESHVLPQSGPSAGDRYMVIYDSVDLPKSVMLFHYRVNDPADSARFLDSFRVRLPDLK